MAQCKFKNSVGKPKHSNNYWCHNCRSKSHDTKFCRNNNSAKVVNDSEVKCDDNDMSFLMNIKANSNNCAKAEYVQNDMINLLVDCGATAHIICDESKFINIYENFDSTNHCIELADGSRSNGIVTAKGDANIKLHD
jgi:hypothetical protein